MHQIPWTSVHNISTMYEKWYLLCDLFCVSLSLLKITAGKWCFYSMQFLVQYSKEFLDVGLTSFTHPCLLYVPGHWISKLCQWHILFLINITLWYQIFSHWLCCEVIILLLLGNGILSCVQCCDSCYWWRLKKLNFTYHRMILNTHSFYCVIIVFKTVS